MLLPELVLRKVEQGHTQTTEIISQLPYELPGQVRRALRVLSQGGMVKLRWIKSNGVSLPLQATITPLGQEKMNELRRIR